MPTLARNVQFGEFYIIHVLEQNGMADVDEAEEISVARVIALKILAAAFVRDEKRVCRFTKRIQALTPPAYAPATQSAPDRPPKRRKREKPQPQQVIVKQKGSGCMTAMMFIILLIIGFPVLLFIFKVGFLIAIFNEIKSFFGL